ncbi:MAG TPA: metallophosphoesterase, partial [Thermosipho africanus]|nr:metallophosphoesterase [Thermosipho africanus]
KLVFSAHEHNYQHFIVDNIHYIIPGGGGAATYNKVLNNENLTFFSKVHNFIILEFNNKFITVKSYMYNGELLEEFNVQY